MSVNKQELKFLCACELPIFIYMDGPEDGCYQFEVYHAGSSSTYQIPEDQEAWAISKAVIHRIGWSLWRDDCAWIDSGAELYVRSIGDE